MNTTKRSLMTSLLIAATLATGCAGTIGNNGSIKLSGPGPTIAVGSVLAVGGGLWAYKTRTDGVNPFNSDGLVSGLGIGIAAVGVGAILYGVYELSTQPEPAPAPVPAPRTISTR